MSLELDLFGATPVQGSDGTSRKVSAPEEGHMQRALSQWMTPFWAAEALVQRHFSDLTGNDVVWDPTCGTGAFLGAIPTHVQAIGSEIDPALAEVARRRTGRRVITGDARQVNFHLRPTAVISNPPFQMAIVDEILERAREWLPKDGRAGFLLPCSALQTASRVVRYSENWSLTAEMLPRTLFPGLQYPLSFVIFTKDLRRAMVGLALYQESDDVANMPEAVREVLERGQQTWVQVVGEALDRLGGRGRLEDIYRMVEPRRPSEGRWWKEQVRKVCQQAFHKVAPAEYALAA